MVRVLVTRPEPGASRTARRLEAQGFQPILLPLTETAALPVEASSFPAAAAVAVTSANAVRHAPGELVAALVALPCHAVGKRTAEACRAAGFTSVSDGPGDAEALAGALADELAGKEIVYLCGRVRFPAFEERLAAAGAHVRPVETYDTVEVDYSGADVIARSSGMPAEAVLLYSAKAASAMTHLAQRPSLKHLFENTEFLVLSARVAEALGEVGGQKVRIAAQPDEDALLALLSLPR
ncbi:uroporphyrinogen-III synthase [Mesorhizobium sp. M1C.F.Ca.ET.193.01.1.1]|uniref:uroporphyrinogen-III synthase n=1 Tax=unclassified Mesorhizobium TaxID=325217 RepID=UPI000FD1AA2A|nr:MULTISPECIES: uroporphyrinogen-III synthase [unclassified Mesorhizobium]TGS92503.1 uroporphyrinogen-III synthase [bacterium M00.F.Ca.ET.177.01.1.1]TGQ50216.1 uroporphyrinogen-III synthase [Mesorhizobium sp. M1C.F.Ca.ET.210.01.1.1]TGQ64903.1 uroporphyrinogen-III synthase [Mesorhizobium sp. M1C.F.Ca.ET.212.01.1.1]TGQ98686.1 uroporphyrinogen-III synthase [Mesorhizobium sp. M1C.F.Ca.ET.204.01.1.1]TGR18983.1 uroporphyrinogen-III synthase [Mesorhizobium sp. M1C.F.Ca.ET.196.01.1.1]